MVSGDNNSNCPLPDVLSWCLLVVVWLVLAPLPLADISIDGAVDESEWQQARVWDELYGVWPFSQEADSERTEMRLLPLPDALYISLVNYQPRATQVARRHARDGWSYADFVQVMIDFSGGGSIAHEFLVSLGGSVKDGTWQDENQRSQDWDGDWTAVTSQYDNRWEVEMRIPWDTVPAAAVSAATREIAFAFTRRYVGRGLMFGFPVLSNQDRPYISRFHRIEIPNHSGGRLNIRPYTSLLRDLRQHRTSGRSGADVLLKRSGHQMNLALNPDFGAAETDDLIVNFSAIEEIQTDKRFFFSENKALFDLTGWRLRLINTRRIGASPDYNCGAYTGVAQTLCHLEESRLRGSDLFAAVKYSYSRGNLRTGVLAAREDDADFSIGRDFSAVRVFYDTPVRALGYLATRVVRPVQKRTALVQAVNYKYYLRPHLRVTGIHMLSTISERGNSDRAGGHRVFLLYTPNQRWEYSLVNIHYDNGFDINDMGYVFRDELDMIYAQMIYRERAFPEQSRWLERKLDISGQVSRGRKNEKLPPTLWVRWEGRLRTTSSLKAELALVGAGQDDLFTGGNSLAPYLQQIARRELKFAYATPHRRTLSLDSRLRVFQEGYGGWAWELQPKLTLLLGDRLHMAFEYSWRDSEDWLVNRGIIDGNSQTLRLNRYRDRKLERLNIWLNWFPAQRHEFTLRTQWVGIIAREGKLYRVDPRGRLLLAHETRAQDFLYSTLNFRVRYRWIFAPLSDLFVVYARGGVFSLGSSACDPAAVGACLVVPDRHNEALFERIWSRPDDEGLFVKLNYRF